MKYAINATVDKNPWARPKKQPDGTAQNRNSDDIALWNTLVDSVIALARTNGWTKAEVARRIGMPDGTFSQWYAGSYAGQLGKQNAKVQQWVEALKETAGLLEMIPEKPAFQKNRIACEIIDALTLAQIHNGEVVTNLNTTGSSLKGPLRIDGDVVYTKAQVDAAILAGIKSLKKDLTDKITNWPALADAELLYTQDGKIEWPDWVTDKTKVEIQAWGGGGSGGRAFGIGLGGGGGGGGCSVWYGYKVSLNGHENIIIGKGGASIAKNFVSGKPGETTTIGKNFITATGGKGGGGADARISHSGFGGSTTSIYSGSGGAGGVGGNFGLATDEHPGIAKGGNGCAGTDGITGKISGNGGDAGGDTSRGGSGGTGQGSYGSGKAGRGFGGGGAGSHGTDRSSGAGADGAILIRLWKD
ncbi:hypothetical protein [Bartonella sp. B1098]|uniref:glycine-rich domain-containing protein n=1 Tax=Bartonella sp. B1098 TaxID=2911421 RepID=UPI0020C4EC60|nr:hypothetical protein [Bartonella sp. B1098]